MPTGRPPATHRRRAIRKRPRRPLEPGRPARRSATRSLTPRRCALRRCASGGATPCSSRASSPRASAATAAASSVLAKPVEDALPQLSVARQPRRARKPSSSPPPRRANGPAIEVHDLPAPLAEHAGSTGQLVATRRLRDLEMQHLRQVLEETRGNKSRAARILGLSRWALQRKLRKHGISLRRRRPARIRRQSRRSSKRGHLAWPSA